VSFSLPFQRVLTLNWTRSVSVSPKSMPPSDPFPSGSASVIHDRAGWAYQRTEDGAAEGSTADSAMRGWLVATTATSIVDKARKRMDGMDGWRNARQRAG